MLGAAWADLFSFIETFYPGAFQLPPLRTTGVLPVVVEARQRFLYYSFVTLTTVGYGDITPVAPFAQRLAVLEAMFLNNGSIGSAERVAGMLGLRNRFQLARLLRREGLPPLHRLTKWVTVLSWLSVAERNRVSLCWMAFRCHRHPSACYRLVKTVTGAGWEELQRHGSDWVLQQFLRELKRYDTLPHDADSPARFRTRAYGSADALAMTF